MTAFYRFMRIFAVIYARVCFKIKVNGIENFPKTGGIVLCANHQSINDVFLLGTVLKRQLHFMGKEELFKNPVAHWFFIKLGSFAVKRGKGDFAAIEFAEKIVKEEKVFAIFPEGTRSKTGEILRAKSGAAVVAAATKAPIVPVAIKYNNKNNRHCFTKATLSFGKPINTAKETELDLTNPAGGRKEIRKISSEIMDSIKTLYEQSN